MTEALILVTFLALIVVLAVLAKRLRVPYPIAFVVGGIALSFARHLPRPHPDPELIVLVVIPPLLYSAAWSTDWFELKRNSRLIALLAFGLVIATMAAVAAVVHFTLPEFTWPLAFLLGAIVAPPDAVASEAIFERIAVPRRVAAVIGGECLMNDATALVLYRFALAAAVSGAFSFARAGAAFVVVAVGGTLVGLATALLLEALLRYFALRGYSDAMIASVVFLLAPFAAYLPAEALHVSGVLAAVAAGIMLSRRSTAFIDPETRVLASSVWRLLTFVLNALAFLLIGLQLPAILEALQPNIRDLHALRIADQRCGHHRSHSLGLSGNVSASFAKPAAARTRSLSALAERGRGLVGGDAGDPVACHCTGVALHAWRPGRFRRAAPSCFSPSSSFSLRWCSRVSRSVR